MQQASVMLCNKNTFSRRQLLHYASALAIGSFAGPVRHACASDSTKFADYPFKLGVASGDPLTEGFVLWTRLAPHPYDLTAMPQQSVPVTWQVAEDELMLKLVRSGTGFAHAEHAHSLHIEVQGLKPDREYFYRFIAGKEESPIGRTRTLPLLGTHLNDFRFAFASCQDISNGYFAAYHDMVKQDPRLIVHTGDYIYEGVYRDGGRRIPVPEAMTLEDYRLLHARYKLDPQLQEAHAATPWLLIWDDHEVENDWGGSYSESISDPEQFLKRKTAAIKAYYEHLPLRLSSIMRHGQSRIYQRTVVGDLIEFNLLDCRQYRDQPPCKEEDGRVPSQIQPCEEALSEERSMLGREQERWLRRGFGHAGVKWNTLVQTAYMAPFDYIQGADRGYKTDGWDGYAATRQRILDLIVDKGISNPIALGGEIHAFYAGIVNAKAFDFDSPAALSELVCTSLTSSGGGEERYKKTIDLFSENPFARFFENRVRGYTLCDVNHQRWHATLRMIENVQDPNSSGSTLKELVIEDGVVDVLTA
jgi:alkaline phosphatase D